MHREFTIGEGEYRSRALDPIVQGHVARRLAPFVTGFAPMIRLALQGQQVFPEVSGVDRRLALFDAAVPLIEFFGQVSTETHDFLVRSCLGVVDRKRGPKWEPVLSRQSTTVESMTGADVMEIVSFVLAGEMGRFIGELMQRLPSGPLPGTRFDA